MRRYRLTHSWRAVAQNGARCGTFGARSWGVGQLLGNSMMQRRSIGPIHGSQQVQEQCSQTTRTISRDVRTPNRRQEGGFSCSGGGGSGPARDTRLLWLCLERVFLSVFACEHSENSEEHAREHINMALITTTMTTNSGGLKQQQHNTSTRPRGGNSSRPC